MWSTLFPAQIQSTATPSQATVKKINCTPAKPSTPHQEKCGIYNEVQKVVGSPINEINWPWTGSTGEFPVLDKRAERKCIFHHSARGWPALSPWSPHCWFVWLMAIPLQHQGWKNIASLLIRDSIKCRFICCRSSSFWRLSPWFLRLWPMTSICLCC